MATFKTINNIKKFLSKHDEPISQYELYRSSRLPYPTLKQGLKDLIALGVVRELDGKSKLHQDIKKYELIKNKQEANI